MASASQNRSLLYAVDETPPLWMSLFLGFQHVLLVFSGIVFVPLIVAKGSGVQPDQIEFVAFASIIVTAVSTLIQVQRFGPDRLRICALHGYVGSIHRVQPVRGSFGGLRAGRHHVSDFRAPGVHLFLFSQAPLEKS